MAESKAAWDRVGEDFKTLGRQVKQHYDARPKPERAQAPQAAEGQAAESQGSRAEGQGQEHAPDRRKLDDALQKLTESLDQAFSALGDAVRDPQVGEQTKKAASSLSDALTATFAEASERFRKK
jgi:hypothetical protein